MGYKYDVAAFERWLKAKGFFSSLDEAVKFQDSATGKDRYKIVDYLIEHVKEKGGTFNGMKVRYTNLRSYFLHKRAELPKVRVTFTPTRDATVGRLGVDSLRILVKEAGLKHGAIILTLFQSLMDQERYFSYFNKLGHELATHLKEKGVDVPFRVDFLRGRKTNPRPFNSWLGRDSLQAWKDYFERERGWPKQQGEAVALDIHGKPLGKRAFQAYYIRLQHRMKFANENGTLTTRYGYNLHELRDLARSILEKVKGEKLGPDGDGFNTNSVELWMGHTIDKLYYTKTWEREPECNLEQYKIAERYLNVISGNQTVDVEKVVDERIKECDSKIADLETRLGDMQNQIGVEVARAFQKVKNVEDEIRGQKDRIEKIGQEIFDEVHDDEMKGLAPELGDEGPPLFLVFNRLPTSSKDFRIEYENTDEVDVLINESFWKKVSAHPSWRKVVKEYARLSELQDKAEKLRQGSAES